MATIHFSAPLRVDVADDGTASLVWCTDVKPDSFGGWLPEIHAPMFEELLAAVHGHHPV